MTDVAEFDRSVFLNCPFDDDFAPILQAVAFCITDLGFRPRIAPENADGGASRLARIVELIRQSRYGIHDLSRSRSRAAGEYSRLNMPFELGLDHAGAQFGPDPLTSKSILVLEETRYDAQKSLSDIAGWDVEAHSGNHVIAVRKVRNWLVNHAGAKPIGAALVLAHYSDFQEWHWERELAQGAAEDEIREYPTIDFIRAMQEWFDTTRAV